MYFWQDQNPLSTMIKKLQNILWVLEFQAKIWLLTISLLKSIQHCQ